jgi:hypothetical protein
VKPLLAAINATPRAIKRYQNRMRYLAARLRPAVYEPDWIDSLLHWLGLRFRRPLVPAAWFEEGLRPAIDEPALILLGAIELFAPKAFASPAELFTQLEHGTPGGKLTHEQIEALVRKYATLLPHKASSCRRRPKSHVEEWKNVAGLPG